MKASLILSAWLVSPVSPVLVAFEATGPYVRPARMVQGYLWEGNWVLEVLEAHHSEYF